jgi:hypothetical protein
MRCALIECSYIYIYIYSCTEKKGRAAMHGEVALCKG